RQRPSSFVIRHSSFVTRHSSFVIRHFKKLSLRPDGFLDLPEGRAAVVPERGQRANLGEYGQLVATDAGLANQILHRRELAHRRLGLRPIMCAEVAETLPGARD